MSSPRLYAPTHTPDARPQGYIPGLDGLRALACLAVFAEHFQQKTGLGGTLGPFDVERWLLSGWGVALLFSLSGFLLSLPLWRNLHTGSPPPRLAGFWARRLVRLAPAYFVCLTILIVHNSHWDEPRGVADTVLHFLFLFNFAEFSFYSINPPFWALGIIFQFYILFPLLFAVARLGGRRGAPWIVGALAIGGYLLHLALMATIVPALQPWPFPEHILRPEGYVLSRSLLAHLPHFLLGALAGHYWITSHSPTADTTSPHGRRFDISFLVMAGLVTVMLGTAAGDLASLPHGRYALPLVPIGLALLVLWTPRAPMARLILESLPIRTLGLISYGIYIYHYPALNLTGRVMERYGVPPAENMALYAAIALGLTIVVSAGSYLLVEKPILKATRRLSASQGP
ncbi:MAG: acyltransferase [Gammaproteobacteria bacterium]|nr:acyltransferase [Gammaproteobacteria bacterium]